MNKYIKKRHFFEKIRSNNATKLNSLQRELKNTLSYDSVRQQDGMFGIRNSSIKHYKKLLTMKTTKKTGKIQKISRKMLEEFRSPLNYKLFSEKFLYNPLNVVISKPMELSILG